MKEPKDQRVQIVASKGDIAAIDGWRGRQPDVPSRSEAIRRLVRLGIEADAAKD